MQIKPYRIGYRTLKTALGMTLAVILSQLIGLDNYASSAILVVLCIKDTRIKSFEAAIYRFIACFIAIMIGSVFFTYLGSTPIILGIMVLLFIPVTVMVGVQEGIVTSCVIILHLYMAKTIDFHLIINEILLLIIGIGIALIMNMFMPSLDHKLNQYKRKIEDDFIIITFVFSEALKDPNKKINTPSFDQVSQNIKKAKSLAFREVKNHFVRNENSYYHYFDMRQEQLSLLKRMKNLIESMQHSNHAHYLCSELMLDVSQNVQSKDYSLMRLHSLYEIKIKLQSIDLPRTHEELESIAALIQLLNEVEEYLLIKSQFGSLKK
ncbi:MULTISPECIES: aromatic acid exporter family protein [Mammaliicoccus]|uniref:Aromatic acid exporter family protein n=1 Tax=Mammaliicoccus fleurettii TaxID=150056 RepID=A0ABS5MKG3_9STAP|nr:MULTISPECIES: aromatic acid exporter family protein [Mammaliicoccus]HCN59678.1 aromatic acid exporter family protein [Staphylococcus sp.]MBL0846164.1 aromatic acid exporter family protein [Mammaliicoccus fleurettii]MBS3671235.1 aromatic acid exporter family protein [Mammaliicoccus fleurettii]MBS3696391.1 aromatic acid exporter family protein [Mammaliicoccus fleurettii]MBW0764071.1 aromatic acid exporter family protein [Mammaliicoccus fleurettii]